MFVLNVIPRRDKAAVLLHCNSGERISSWFGWVIAAVEGTPVHQESFIATIESYTANLGISNEFRCIQMPHLQLQFPSQKMQRDRMETEMDRL
jgi:hypothetical protein